MNRWLKTGKLSDETKEAMASVKEKQQWVLITEPWCGDAAHVVPFIYSMSEPNPMIELEIQLRDADSEIDRYLTNGGKSVPKLIVRDAEGKDLAVWGPRPAESQLYFEGLKAQGLSLEDQKAALQDWYNKDKGEQIQAEFTQLLMESLQPQ